MKSKQEISKANQAYVYDYDAPITVKYHAGRTAEKQAGWFLPYLQSGMSLLDCGCGSGSITVGLAKAVGSGHVIGVDVSAQEIQRAQERAAENELTNIRFEVGDIYQLGFPDNCFDALFSHNCLEHIPEPIRVLQEMRRVLKPGGVLGIRDCDYGGVLLAPDTGFWKKLFAIWETDYRKSGGGNPRIGRRLGVLSYEAGFLDVKMSASYEVYSDIESRKFFVGAHAPRLTDADFVDRATGSGLSTFEELKALRNAWQAWTEHPGAFLAVSHCEAVGRKAE